MAVFQDSESELGFLRRNNLKSEANYLRNLYRDLIRSRGIIVNYYKHDTNSLENFNGIIDRNALIRAAYGYDPTPKYEISAEMFAFPDVETDNIFNLNKTGLVPNTDITFSFDKIDFACSLATKLGQYKEFKINETEIICEVPDITNEYIESTDPITGKIIKNYLSSYTFPYKLGLGSKEEYFCDMLSGKMSVEISGYEYDKETTVICHPYEYSDLCVDFSAFKELYKAFHYQYKNQDYLETLLFLTFKVTKINTGIDKNGNPIYKNILHGKTHGSVLFYDLTQVGKYLDLIHPEVGDIITIDFPDENNREQYQITQCIDRLLTPDGISPLLHTYIWQCKARRYIAQGESTIENNQSNIRLNEKILQDQKIDGEIAKSILFYPDNEDAAYGGDSPAEINYDAKKITPFDDYKFKFINDGSAINLIVFGCGSKLVTTGYELLFVSKDGMATQITTDSQIPVHDAIFEQGLKYLKAGPSILVYINILGEMTKIVCDYEALGDNIPIQLDSLTDKTAFVKNPNSINDNFYKFRNTKTYLFADTQHLYCHLESNNKLYMLA